MGFGWFLFLTRVLRGKGDLRYFYHYTKQLIKENPLPTYLSVIILIMSFTIVNYDVKLHILLREKNEAEIRRVNECAISDPVIIPVPIEGPVAPTTPPPIQVEEKVVVPNIRRYAADRLNEISRSLDNEGS